MCMTDEQFTAYTLQAAMLLAVTNAQRPIARELLHGDVHELYMISFQPVVLTRLCVTKGKAAGVIVLPYADWRETMSEVELGPTVVDRFAEAIAANIVAIVAKHAEEDREWRERCASGDPTSIAQAEQ